MLKVKSRQKLACISLILMFMLFLYCYLPDWNNVTCAFDYDCKLGGIQPDRSKLRNETEQIRRQCAEKPYIFFMETSGATELNARQACAIESAARHNPTMPVMVLMTCYAMNFSNVFIADLLQIPNITIAAIDVETFLHGTPLLEWYRAGEWKKSEWKISHLSDGLRYLIMWAYGGMYLDLDTVTLRSMEHLRNAVITENGKDIAAGILVFGPHDQLMHDCVYDFIKNYDRRNFARNGPGVITNMVRKFCNVKEIAKVNSSQCDVNVLPPPAAFPIRYSSWSEYFKPNNITNIAKHFSDSYLIHVWNKFSSAGKVSIGENSLYEVAIKENCPLTYKHSRRLKYI